MLEVDAQSLKEIISAVRMKVFPSWLSEFPRMITMTFNGETILMVVKVELAILQMSEVEASGASPLIPELEVRDDLVEELQPLD